MSKKIPLPAIDHTFPDDWRGQTLTRIRELIQEADPEVKEDVKWRTASNPNGVLVWYHDGMLLTGETYKKHLRLAFARGVELKEQDTESLINSHRAMIIQENDTVNEAAFIKLIQEAVKLNQKNRKSD